MKQWVTPCVKGMILLAACVLIGLMLLVAVYAIPTEAVWQNVEASVGTLTSEGKRYYSIPGYEPSRLDNYTDAIMLGNAVVAPEESVLQNALLVYRLNELDPEGSLKQYIEGRWNEEMTPYSNYWHGYLVLLKPLLCLINYNSIRYLEMVAQLFAFLAVTVLLAKRNMTGYSIPLFAMYMCLCPIALMNTITYGSMYFVGMLTVVLMLFMHERIEKWGYGYLFLMVGALTSYLDLLTYPVFTLGIPLTVYILLVRKAGKRASLMNMAVLCFAWCVGYGGMWIFKWVLVTLFTKSNGLQEAFIKILYRTNNYLDFQGDVSIFAGIQCALALLLNPLNIMVLLGCAAACVLMVWRCGMDWTAKSVFAKLLLVALIPFAWMLFACNHTVSHTFFAYRCLSVTVFAGGCALVSMADSRGRADAGTRH